jgi:hypothetical protein
VERRSSDAAFEAEAPVAGLRTSRTDRPRVGAAVIVAALAIVAVVSVETVFGDRTPSVRTPDGQRPASGTLLFLARSDDGSASLWLFDPAAGAVRPGPAVPRATVDLVDVSGAAAGWVGLERVTADRGRGVSVLQGVDPGADALALGRGDLVAWGPGGASLVFARNGRKAAAGCVPVRIRLLRVLTQKVEWALDDPGFCGPVLSLSRSAAATYFTAASGDRLSVYLTGSVGIPHLMFEGLAMLSASPPSAFLLSPDRPAGRSSPADRTLLGWKGIGGPVTVGSGGDALSVDRVLAWSPDGAEVALVGSLGSVRGVFILEAGSGERVREPRFLMPAGAQIDATFDRDGRLYLAVDGRILAERRGSVTTLTLPEGAPPPAGPIVWIP